MKNKLLSIAIGATLTSASFSVLAMLPVNANLTFEDGIINCVAGVGTPPDACVYGTDVTAGSWFALDTNDDGTIQPAEKIPMNLDRGIFLGITQEATGNHAGAVTGAEDTNIDLAWNFFGNTGVHKTPSTSITINSADDGAVDGIATLDFSGWGFGWENNNMVPLGGDAANFPGDTGLASMKCYTTPALRDAGGAADGSCNEGEYYTLDYAAHPALSDLSGLGGVGYTLHLVGQQIIQPQVTVQIDIPDGNLQECNITSGTVINAISNVNLDPSDAIFNITWTLDGMAAGTGSNFNQLMTLGTHDLGISVNTVNGASGTDMRTVTIEDTIPPMVTAQFTNKFTGAPINTMQLSNNFIAINTEASDACDPSATVTDVMYGTLSADGGYFLTYGYSGGLVIQRSQLDLRVEATDSSGNISVETAVVNAP